MAVYEYDDFEIRLVARPDGDYDAVATLPDGSARQSTFRVPLSTDELEQTVVSFARTRAARSRAGTREVAPASVAASSITDTEAFGALLADALFGEELGAAYDRSRQTTAVERRGLRLSLSLADAPALLSLPWEFLYRRPRFLASQRHTPLVRRLETGFVTAPPAITDTVRILGVIASPSDLTALDVDAERDRVQRAVRKMCDAGRVELEWLEPATPRRLRERLRDETFHILHFVGHSSFVGGDGAIYLEDDAGGSSAVDSTVFANLLADQSSLRLVVLNSCEGARTTLTDPYAGVATTLIQLGVPAVVAMQFEISDEAAILFADELYTNLIGRQDPIGASVAEARKAIYVELDKVEWATPVLFVRDPDVQLFDFRVGVAPLPPPPAPQIEADETATTEAGAGTSGAATPPPAGGDGSVGQPTGGASTSPAEPPEPDRSRRRPLLSIALAALVVLGLGVVVVMMATGADDATSPTTTAGSDAGLAVATEPPADERETRDSGGLAPRPRTGVLAVQVLEPDGDVHLYPIQLQTGAIGVITDRPGAVDTEGVWDRATNRVAFTRRRPGVFEGSGIFYVVPGDFGEDSGKQVAPLVPFQDGNVDHDPAWSSDGSLFYARTVGGCDPGPGCGEELRTIDFVASDDGTGHLDALSPRADSERGVAEGFEGIAAVAAHPVIASRVAVADVQGIWLASRGDSRLTSPRLVAPGVFATSIAFTADGSFLVALTGSGLAIFDAEGARVASGSSAATYVSLTPGPGGATVLALQLAAAGSAPTVDRLAISGNGDVGVDVSTEVTGRLGVVQAIAF